MTPPCDVMILCAGLGTRLQPLTFERAKPAVPLMNRPLVGYPLALAKTLGVSSVAINTHWLPGSMAAAAASEASKLELELQISHEPVLLGTGGGLWQAREKGLFSREKPLLVLNGDVLFDVDLPKLVQLHQDNGAAATMVLRPMPPGATYSPVQADASGRITRIAKFGTPTDGPNYLFSGIHVLSPEALDLLPSGESGVIERSYAPLLARGARIQAAFEAGLWLDLGDPKGYLDAHLELLSGTLDTGALERCGVLPRSVTALHPKAEIAPTASVTNSVIGSGARIGAGAKLVDCVVWENATVAPREELSRTIVTYRERVTVAP